MEKKGWVLVDPGSAAGLDGSMAKAVERGENWILLVTYLYDW